MIPRMAIRKGVTTQKDLEERTTYLNALIQNSPIGIVVLDSQHRVQMCNTAFEQLFQYQQEEIMRTHLDEFIAPKGLSREAVELTRRVLAGSRVHAATRRRRKDGTLVDVEVYGVPLIVDGKLTGVYGLYQDITERRQFEESLRHLSGRLLHLQDEERKRIARELHDTTIQNLVALSANIAQLKRLITKSNPRIEMLLAESLALMKESVDEIRTFSYLLHPPALDQFGLCSALRWYVAGFERRSGIRVELALPRSDKRLPPDTEMALFRIVQESLTNILRHAGSPTARIRFELSDCEARLEISDNGRGIPTQVLPKLQSGSGVLGVGITGMRERMKQLGGKLEIRSSDSGTAISVALPVQTSEP